MEKIMCIFDLFRKGEQVANPEAWKDSANMGLLLGALIMGVLSALKVFFKIDIPMDLDTANSIGAGFGCLLAFVVNNISSKRAGILPAKEAEHPIAVPDIPVPHRADELYFEHPEEHPQALPDIPEGQAAVKGISAAGMQNFNEADLKEALAALRRDRKRPPTEPT